MVFVILTRTGFDQLRERFVVSSDAAWLNGGILSAAEVKTLRDAGWNLTTWSQPQTADDILSNIETVRPHHPGDVIWVEIE